MKEQDFGPEDILDFTQVKFERNMQRFAKGPVDVTWEVTNECNLRCKHCFLTDAIKLLPDELSTAEAYALIDNLIEVRAKSILFSRGPPGSKAVASKVSVNSFGGNVPLSPTAYKRMAENPFHGCIRESY